MVRETEHSVDKLPQHSPKLAGLKKHYEDCFADIFADATQDDIHQEAVIESFLSALDGWLTYHVDCAQRYKLMRERIRSSLGMS